VFDPAHDARIRAAAFAWLGDQIALHGDVLPRTVLAEGFRFDDTRVPLLGPQGIFKPRVMSEVPLSITTAPHGPYDDSFGPDELLRYRYRGTDPDHSDNKGLRFAMERRLPLVYIHGVVPGKYLVTWPVFVVEDDPENLTFSVAVDDARHLGLSDNPALQMGVREDADTARRTYITAAVRVRLHQRAFRERVLEAYRRQCAFCRLRHEELLDAAHIIPDSEPGGEPVVHNGLSLCTLHHAAFDRYFIGLRPDFTLEVREDLRRERDGPTLLHAIQGLHDRRIELPRRAEYRPARDLLEIRYQRFREATEGRVAPGA
jgi:putative restriction endonuclease